MTIKAKKLKMTQIYDADTQVAVTPLVVQSGEIGELKKGDLVRVSGKTKAKGFQGVVKRHGFSGGPRSHGQKDRERAPGAIGGGSRAGARVRLGMRMAGRMGGVTATILNLTLAGVDAEKKLIFVKGAVPGHAGKIVTVTKK